MTREYMQSCHILRTCHQAMPRELVSEIPECHGFALLSNLCCSSSRHAKEDAVADQSTDDFFCIRTCDASGEIVMLQRIGLEVICSTR